MISGVRSGSQAGYLSPRSAASVTRLDMAHSNSAGGKLTAMSTRASPASAMSASAAGRHEGGHLGVDDGHAQVDGDDGPLAPQAPGGGSRGRPPSPRPRGRLWVSWGSYPLHTSYQRAVSRTDRLMQPTVTVWGVWCTWGPLGMRP